MGLPASLLPEHDLLWQYRKHQSTENRPQQAALDIGAFERCDTLGCDLIFADGFD